MSSARCGILVGVVVLLAACGDDGPGGSMDTSAEGANQNCGNETRPTYLIIESEADLAELDGVRVIEGDVQVNRTSLTDLDAFGCLEEVGGMLTIFGNAELTDLSGLDRLERIGGGFVFSENTAVPDLAGLGSLREIGEIVQVEVDGQLVDQPQGSLVIQDNDAMTGISGMTSLATIWGALNIRDNDVVEHIDGLRGLRTLGTQFAVTHNPSLCISSVNQVGAGITDPAQPRDNWSSRANDDGC